MSRYRGRRRLRADPAPGVRLPSNSIVLVHGNAVQLVEVDVDRFSEIIEWCERAPADDLSRAVDVRP